jgi:hypothetical protein
MTTADEDKRMDRAVSALTEACFAIAQRLDVCPLCLMYECANIASEAEEDGQATHRGAPQQTHPQHKTIV